MGLVNILVLNAGSSSLKFRLFEMNQPAALSEPETVLARGQVERIGKPDATLTFQAVPDPSGPDAATAGSSAAGPDGGGNHGRQAPAQEAVVRVKRLEVAFDVGQANVPRCHHLVEGGHQLCLRENW